MTDYEFIKNFQKIKLTNICKRLGVNQSNVLSKQTTEENYKKIKNEINNELLELFKSDCEKLVTFYLYNEMLERVEKENKVLREMI